MYTPSRIVRLSGTSNGNSNSNNPFNNFLRSRGGQFFKMGSEQDLDAFGPPAILLHGIPLPLDVCQGIVSEALDIELQDIQDGGLAVAHLSAAAYGQSLETVLEAASISTSTAPPSATGYFQDAAPIAAGVSAVPIVYFSGMPNGDVKAAAAAIIGRVFEETGQRAGLAKAVPPAMEKLLGDLLGEIEGDHQDALARLGNPNAGI